MYRQKSAQHIEQSNLEKPSLESLRAELLEGLAKHELKDVDALYAEIIEIRASYEKAIERHQVTKASQLKEQVDQLEYLYSLISLIAQLEEEENNPILEEKARLDALQIQLQEGLARYELKNVDAIEEEIKEVSSAYRSAIQKNQVNKAEKYKGTLEELNQLKALVDAIVRSQEAIVRMSGTGSIEDTKEYIANSLVERTKLVAATEDGEVVRLRQMLQNGLADNELADQTELQDEILELQSKLAKAVKNEQNRKSNEIREQLQKLEELQQLATRIAAMSQEVVIALDEQASSEQNTSQGSKAAFIAKDIINNTGDILVSASLDVISQETPKENIDIVGQPQADTVSPAQLSAETKSHSQELSGVNTRSRPEGIDVYINKKHHKAISNDRSETFFEPFIVPKITEKLQQDESIEAKKYCEAYERFNYYLQTMPECAEKSIALLLYNFQSEQFREKIAVDLPLLSSEQVMFIFNKLKHQLEVEGLFDRPVRQMIKDIDSRIADVSQIRELFNEFLKLMKHLQPVDVDLMLSYIEKTESAAKKIQGRDIILLLGGTGTGKSTTIHFLAGSTMEKVQVFVKDHSKTHIKPVKITNPELNSVVTTHLQRSETKSINPITIDARALGVKEAGEITLCDSPGFGDTEGVEVDIANGIGIVRAVKGSRSVKPVILVSQKSLGDRSEGLTKLVGILVTFMPEIKKHLNAFTYVFTKYGKEDSAEIQATVASKEENLTYEEKANQGLTDVFLDMVEKTKREVIILDPVHDNVAEFLDKLHRSPSITNPATSFQDFATPESLSKLKEQLYKHKNCIEGALDRVDIPLLSYKVDQMARINKNLIIPESRRLHEKYMEGVTMLIESLLQQVEARLKVCINNGNANVESDVILCSQKMLALHDIELVRKNYLPQLSDLTELCALHIDVCCKELQDRILKTCDVSNLLSDDAILVLKVDLNKLHLLTSVFKTTFSISKHQPSFLQDLQNACEIARQALLARYSEHESLAADTLQAIDFEGFVINMDVMKVMQEQFAEYFDDGVLANRYLNLQQSCQLILSNIEKELLVVGQDNLLDDVNIEKVKKSFEIVQAMGIAYGLERHLNKGLVATIASNLEIAVNSYVKQLDEKLIMSKDHGTSVVDFAPAYATVQKLDLLRINSQIKYATMKPYNDIAKNLKSEVSELKRCVQQYLGWVCDSPLGTVLPIDYAQIANGIWGLKSASIFSGHPEGIYERELQDLKQMHSDFVTKVQRNLSNVEFPIESSEDLKCLIEVSKQLKGFIVIEEALAEEEVLSYVPISEFSRKVAEVLAKAKEVLVGESFIQDLVLLKKSFEFVWICCLHSEESYFGVISEILDQSRQHAKTYFSNLQINLEQNYELVFDNPGLEEQFFKEKVSHVVSTLLMLYELKTAYHDIDAIGEVELQQIRDKKLLSEKAINLTKSLQELSKLVFESGPGTILNEWIFGVNSKLCQYHSTIEQDIKNINDGQSVPDVLEKMKLARELKILDRAVGDQFSYTSIVSELEIASRTQQLTIANELNLLAAAGNYDEFQVVYRKTIDSNPGLSIELSGPVQMLSQSLRARAQELLHKIDSFIVDETTLESAYVIFEGYGALCIAAKIMINLLPEDGNELNDLAEKLSLSILEKIKFYKEAISKYINEARVTKVEAGLGVLRAFCAFFTASKHGVAYQQLNEEITSIYAELYASLNSKLDALVTFYAALPVSEYAKDSPKFLMDQLAEAMGKNIQYEQARQKIKGFITAKILETLGEASKDLLTQQELDEIKAVGTAAIYLPADLPNEYVTQLKQAQDCLEEKDQQLNRMLKESAAAHKLRELVDKLAVFSEQNNFRYAFEVSVHIRGVIEEAASRFRLDLEKGDFAIVIKSLPESWSDWWYYGIKLNEISKRVRPENKHYFSSEFVRSVIDNMLAAVVAKISETLRNVENQNLNDVKAYFRFLQSNFEQCKALIILLDVYQKHKSVDDAEPHFYDDLCEKMLNLTTAIVNAIKFIVLFFENNQKKFLDGVSSTDFLSVRELLDANKDNFVLMQSINAFLTSDIVEAVEHSIKKRMLQIVSYPEMSKKLAEKLLECNSNLRVSLLHHSELSTADQVKRDNFYRLISNSYVGLMNARLISDHIDEKIFDLKMVEGESKNHFMRELEKLKDELLTLIQSFPSEKKETYDEFNIWLDNLRSFRDNFADASLAQEAISLMKDVERAFEEKMKELRDVVLTLKTVDQLAECLVAYKSMATLIPVYHKKIMHEIDAALLVLSKSENGEQKIATLGLTLRQIDGEEQDAAIRLISEHIAFKSYAIAIRNQKTSRYKATDVLNDLKGDHININQLEAAIVEHEKLYWAIVEESLVKVDDAKRRIVHEVKQIVDLQIDFVEKVVKLSAHLFAFWTLDNSSSYTEIMNLAENSGVVSTKKEYLLQPHPAQVISVFRLLGVDFANHDELENHLVQIGTGEGKSVTLAITASILSLMGYSVDCACYSEYLSTRDFEAFSTLFMAFKLTDKIRYGTFNKLSEDFLNRHGDVREMILSYVSPNPPNTPIKYTKSHMVDNRILLIDEVDVFFGKDFYGNWYRPLAELKDPTISALIQLIWSLRNDKSALTFAVFKTKSEFTNCVAKFKGWEFLIERAVREMLADVATFEQHDYVVKNDRIGYKEQDGVSFDVSYGYKTLFAYFKEVEVKNISPGSLASHLGIVIDTGIYSYAEVPRLYRCIMGVTGTLETSKLEKDILQSYGIQKFTFMPSVYGRNQLEFAGNSTRDVVIESGMAGYFVAIGNEIQKRLQGTPIQRSVLVFFETKATLHEFYNTGVLDNLGLKNKVAIITEEVSNDEKEGLIVRAAITGNITLLTAEFGRGTDFKSYDDRMNESGGMHVIQTFVSDSLSEETQIKGRTARQGNVGSYSMVLLSTHLERFKIMEADIDTMRSRSVLYDVINAKRVQFFENQFSEMAEYVAKIREQHAVSENFIKALVDGDVKAIKEFVKNRSELKCSGTNLEAALSRTICLIDATGSMSSLLLKVKNTVNKMFDRAREVLEEKGMNPASFELQFVAYRNYTTVDKAALLQKSPWESNANNLRAFMHGIEAKGGTWMEEAIEVALQYVHQEVADGVAVNQVILIGDAPPNTREQVTKGRKHLRKEDLEENSFLAKETYYENEVQFLQKEGIPIHAFYVQPDAKDCFEFIARSTGGVSEPLDIDTPAGSERLTQVITERILAQIGGEKLVDSYRTMYVKGYVSSSTKSALLFSDQGQVAEDEHYKVNEEEASPTVSDNRAAEEQTKSKKLVIG